MNAESRNAVRPLPVAPEVVPHRKNAAEWVMWLALWPASVVVRWAGRLRRRRGAVGGGE